MNERRRDPRVRLRHPVQGAAGSLPLFVLDVSRGGLRVAHESQLPDNGGICRVDVPLPKRTIHLDCAVVHTSLAHAEAAAESVFQSGLRIIKADPGLDEIIESGEEEQD
ncbi:MAG TPA: PilZ domain-containing protein [Thermoanaerobaculia bacterium]|nr:PilZ domain-containing protein [Thermoanaerobaculia bacterium]